MRHRSSIIALAVLPGLFAMTACKDDDMKLPEARIDRAATCYSAAMIASGANKHPMSVEQANHVAQFVYLGIVNDGIAEESKLGAVMQKAATLLPEIEKAGNAAKYKSACAKAYPATVAGSFKGLPSEDRSAKMMCVALSTATLQVYEANRITPPSALIGMNTKVDSTLLQEINAQGKVNPAEIAGLAMRSMAKAVESGPTTEVLAACIKQYPPS